MKVKCVATGMVCETSAEGAKRLIASGAFVKAEAPARAAQAARGRRSPGKRPK